MIPGHSKAKAHSSTLSVLPEAGIKTGGPLNKQTLNWVPRMNRICTFRWFQVDHWLFPKMTSALLRRPGPTNLTNVRDLVENHH